MARVRASGGPRAHARGGEGQPAVGPERRRRVERGAVPRVSIADAKRVRGR